MNLREAIDKVIKRETLRIIVKNLFFNYYIEHVITVTTKWTIEKIVVES